MAVRSKVGFSSWVRAWSSGVGGRSGFGVRWIDCFGTFSCGVAFTIDALFVLLAHGISTIVVAYSSAETNSGVTPFAEKKNLKRVSPGTDEMGTRRPSTCGMDGWDFSQAAVSGVNSR